MAEVDCRYPVMREESMAQCSGALFEDLDFPCADSSLFSDSTTPIARLQGEITWRRPQEICQSPALFPSNINLAHAKQGLLGDCWFLCASSVLLKNKRLLNKVFPADQPLWGNSRYRGFFRFFFWQQGNWTEVTIDDRLPCFKSTLCFSHCHSPSAFWVALLEKAYAKLHGSYEHLWAGQVAEALVDLTGGVAERWSLGDFGSEEEQRTERDSDRVQKKKLDLNLLSHVKDDCALSCSTHGAPGGLGVMGQHHALTVMEWLNVKTVSGSEVWLLRIRNPWGRCCWGGAWTWSGVGWSSLDPDCAVDLKSRLAEGEFWLDEAEFTSQFDEITVGYPMSEEGHLKSIYTGNFLTHSHQLAGRWVKGYSAGGSRNASSYSSNPKFWLKVCERGEVLISLLQHRKWRNRKNAQKSLEDGKNIKHQHYQAIALHMWKVEKKHFNLSRTLIKPICASTHCHAYEREVVLRRQLDPGYYLLIPSTYQPGAETHFLIRVFSSSSISLSALKSPAPSLPLTADGEWETTSFCGSWVEGRTAGGSRNFLSYWQNPRFSFTVCDEPDVPSGVNVKISLHQSCPDTDLLPIGFHVYKVPRGGSEQMTVKEENLVASCTPHCHTQDVSLACTLPPGSYTIVPSTYQPDCSANFSLSLARRIHRKVVKSQEQLGRMIQEVSHVSVMKK
ncbi:calpain-10 [Nematolebias whitei]|uniref:calpain-10 n=1 Tax=Nematolebias whitei TaxID=451745 RepID=UPI0018992089|nr:calpain-10 [Nematolebias whitei]